MRGITQRAELRASNALLLKQVDAEKEHYAALTEQYEAMRRMRHDIANHLYTIQALLDNGDTKHAAEYAKEILPRHYPGGHGVRPKGKLPGNGVVHPVKEIVRVSAQLRDGH